MTIHDLHATILHLLGIDHEKLTYRFNGRDYRLTDVGMGGIDRDATYDIAGVSRDTFESICAIAVGTRGTGDDLDSELAAQNLANDRKPVSEVAFKGSYTGLAGQPGKRASGCSRA